MKEIYDLKELKGGFFSPISVIISVGLIGVGIGLCKDVIVRNFKGIILRR